MAGIEWNYTTWLNIAALVGFAVLYGLYRGHHGGGQGYAKDPVCGMQVETANAPASTVHDGRRFHFCSDHCQEAFTRDPDRYGSASSDDARPASSAHTPTPRSP